MSAQRKALIVANDEYEHEGLGQLIAPSADAQALAAVLGDEQIGDFDVRVMRNEPAHVIQAQIEELFSDARPDDLLLLHFSCHGLKNESGELFFASANTRPNRLGSTAVSADFVQRCMRTSRSRSVVLLLDCCYGGAFARGVTVRAAGDVGVLSSFPREQVRSGRGRAVITASSAMEYAFEGDQLADDTGPHPSVFTTALVEGLATGDADRDQDGWVSLDELYDYVFDKVRERNPHQTPSRDVEMQGDLYVARRSRPVATPGRLEPELRRAVSSPLAGIRAGAVQELALVLHGDHAGLALAARLALEDLARDDSRQVSAAALAVLRPAAPSPPPPAAAVPAAPVEEEPAAVPEAAVAKLPAQPRAIVEPAAPEALRGKPLAAMGPAAEPDQAAKLESAAKPETAPAKPTRTARFARATRLPKAESLEAAVAPRPAAPSAAATPKAEKAEATQAGAPTAEAPKATAPKATVAKAATPKAEAPGTAAAEPPVRPAADLRLRLAGLLAVVEAILLADVPFVRFTDASDYRLISYAANTQQLFIDAAVILAAGICLLIPAISRLVGAGLLLGATAVVPSDVAFVVGVLRVDNPVSPGPGTWLVGSAEVLGLAAAVLVGLSLRRGRPAQIEPRSLIGRGRLPAQLMVLLGVAGAVAYAIQVGRATYVPGLAVAISHQLVIPLIWTTIAAVAIPLMAAAARPRAFGTALAGGWICAGLGEVSILTGFKTGVFGYTLVALAVVLIPFARTAGADEPLRPPGADAADKRLTVAGATALVAAALIVIAPYRIVGPVYNLLDYDADKRQLMLIAAGALAAGICLLTPAVSRRAGAGLLLGLATAIPANGALTILVLREDTIRLGGWLVVAAEILIIVAAGLAALALRRNGAVAIAPRLVLGRAPGQRAAWLVAGLGVASAAAFLIQVAARTEVPGLGATDITHRLLFPLVWTTVMALAVPAVAVAARPRLFGTALAGGWIIGALAEAMFVTPLPASAFGYALAALALALIPFARSAPPAPVSGSRGW